MLALDATARLPLCLTGRSLDQLQMSGAKLIFFFPGNVEHKAWHSCRTSAATALIISFFKQGIFIASMVNE